VRDMYLFWDGEINVLASYDIICFFSKIINE